ncbi:uncharacterized protein LOC122402590 [Colletes gigas]|uniref:uncharacterized protein LOC122402590 n=1 Tax=Colletes gigas TaxID=935657 RepID=UPI001C9B25D5|nr:uncharacterized protein LOC122402590 [Colletes gigas]
MESSNVKSNSNPREKANFVSVLLWWWTIGLFKTGYKKVLQTDDLYDPLKTDRSNVLGDRLEKQWNVEVDKSKKGKYRPSLLKAIFRTFLWEYFLLGLMQILNEFILRLGAPILLGGLLRYFQRNATESYETALLYAGGICLATAINVITFNQAIFGAFHVGARIRVAACSVVYRKALRLSKTALGETAPGKVVNLVANDVNRFDLVSIFIHYMWSAPLSGLIIAYILYTEAGYAGLIGIAAVFIVVPIQSYTGKLSSKFRLQTAIKTDERVRLMDEIISGVQVIKMYAWEKPFCALIEMARKLELKVVTKSSYIRGIYMTFNLFTTRMALFCTLISMLLFGNELSADTVFVFSSYFNILAQTMSGMFVRGFAEIAECMVAVRRLQHFLMYEEFQEKGFTLDKLTASLNGSINSDSKQTANKSSRQDLPYIDDEIDSYENLDDSAEKRRHNGLVVVASDLLKNTANLMEERKRSSMVNEETYAVKMRNVSAKWEPGQSENTLENVNLQLEKGKMYAVIGMVGAGKSSFLSAILGEIDVPEGQVKVNGSLSYAGQEAWVFGSTVRQNILFGQPYERQRYQRVIKACSLVRDFKQFPRGDQTIVGERGSSLSGGQKARINLARSLYRQADIYLLDDPLSAVDTHVSKHLFEECMQRYLAGKTRILATHQLQYVKSVDSILLIEQGKVTVLANYPELLNQRPEYYRLLAAETETNDDSSLEKSVMRRQFSSSSTRSRTPEASSGGTDDEEEDEDPEVVKDGLEGTSRGKVKGSIFIKYFRTGANLCLTITVFLLYLATQCTVSLNDYFVPVLVNAEEARHYSLMENALNATNDSMIDTTSDVSSIYGYLYIYTAIVLGIFFIGIIRSFLFYKVCILCSQKLHDMAFSALIRTGMRFFDTNPSGRILNRFSKDMGAIDELLPKAILDASQICLMMFGSLAVSCMVNPLFLIPIAFLGAVFYWIRKVFLKTSKNIKRMDGITRSPVFTHLNATLNGLTTIRAYCAQDILKQEFDKLQDVHTSTIYMYVVASTAFGFCLDIFCFLFTSLVTFSFLVLEQAFSGGEVGLAITQVMAMTGMIQWGMRQNAEVANQMMSVERVLEYTQIAPEPNLRDKGKFAKKTEKQAVALPVNAPKNWPTDGLLKFKNVYMRYVDDEPPVLKNLNLVIRSGEKVGIVGRTGAGKSSLISALFRLAKVEGSIEIDGIDTGTICLEDLRRSISIIPQDPVLFSGTLRRNLDPFNEFSDKALWEALEEVELKDAVSTAGTGLESRVLDRGSNYSVGQRQLVCLARAILRNNRILMLDEATANVDPQTDALIQHTIRKKFDKCTVLTVAHRLNTIMDSDKVLVMDKGRMAEYDHPHILLQNSHSQFTLLVKETDRSMYDQLVKVAKQSYTAKHGERNENLLRWRINEIFLIFDATDRSFLITRMESKNVYMKRNPRETANPINRLFFGWTKELFRKGARKNLVLTDLYHPLTTDESGKLGERLTRSWLLELRKLDRAKDVDKKSTSKNTPRLELAMLRTFWAEYFRVGLLTFLQYAVLAVLQPILQSWIIGYFKIDEGTNTTTKTEALIYAGCLVICIMVIVFIMHHADLMSQQVGMRLRIACSSLIYSKILRLSRGSLTQTTSGQVVNFLSNDMSRFEELCYYLNFVWIAPFQIIIIAVIMWQRIGISTIVGIGALLVMTIPVNTVSVRVSRKLRGMIARLTDRRVQLMNELVAGIQVIKMYVWEKPFATILANIRASEIAKIRIWSYVRATYLSFVVFANRAVLFFTLLSYVSMGNKLKPDTTFMLATYYEMLQLVIAYFCPQAFIVSAEVMVSLRRIQQFLLLEEQSEKEWPPVPAHANGSLIFKKRKKEKEMEKVEAIKMTNGWSNTAPKENEQSAPVSVELERVSANWIPKQLPPTLCHVSMHIRSGELCTLVGTVGSGKSSILYLLLKELTVGAGRLTLRSNISENVRSNNQGYVADNPNLKISYASQEPWLFSGTVRENILFGQPFNRDRYVAVTKACALTKDFQQLPYGDMSNVGESGSSLSGGQKARVNLARAVYKQADIYLLDDPLSAVDARVAKHLFDKCIQEFLQGKTRILVTHQLQFVKQADMIVVLDRGYVKMQGSYDELSNSNSDFADLIDLIKMTTEARKQSEIIDSSNDQLFADRRLSRKSCRGRLSIRSNASSMASYNYEDSTSLRDGEEETIATGSLSKLYTEYFHHGGSYFALFALVLVFIVSQAATSGNDYWVSYWTNLEVVRRSVTNGSQTLIYQNSYMFNNTFLSSIVSFDKYGLLTTSNAIYIYAFCMLSCIMTVFARNIFFMKVCTIANQNLHNKMFSNVLQTTLSFFHSNPSGRILNRFSKDVGAMDEQLPRAILEAVQIFLVIIGVLIMVMIMNHWMIIPLAILGILFYFMGLLYLRTAQSIKRLEGVAKSPVFSHINATLSGLTTIRTSGPEIAKLLQKQFDVLQNVHTGAWYMTIVTHVTFGLYLDIIACFFVACICFSFILLDTGDTLGGYVGLAISQSLIIIGTLQYGVRQSGEMVSQITSVERIMQYTRLPSEGSWESDNPPPSDWPEHGRVSLKNVSMKYETDEPPVLKNLNVTIEAGWKVGVVGRTGAGKSSLISAFFRLFNEGLEGEISIDGTNTSTLGLHELRSRISIIPQQPFLFSESLRYNLDPLNSYNDMLLWDSLHQVELNDLVLDQKVMYSGSNLSIGQRQLICLARAILRNNRILVLDEATANIDSHTDALIQRTIRTRFANCTVITIAHRLNTIIDSDRIIVMDAGRVMEFGCPYTLLRDRPKGIFSQMVENTGVTMAQTLYEQAEKAFSAKNTEQRSLDLTRQCSIETDTTDIIVQSSL